MTTAAAYAKAIYDLDKAKFSKEYFANLKNALESRGHRKLLPAILSEYEKLELAAERSKTRSAITPESERNRQLLELYRRLVSNN
ncbi:MAG TPA: hypothetical protein VN665_03465 [Candidatus Paceibacterota bacterium]|nr:hypothetical protein [Candidatus Paceibacterota bacterium]